MPRLAQVASLCVFCLCVSIYHNNVCYVCAVIMWWLCVLCVERVWLLLLLCGMRVVCVWAATCSSSPRGFRRRLLRSRHGATTTAQGRGMPGPSFSFRLSSLMCHSYFVFRVCCKAAHGYCELHNNRPKRLKLRLSGSARKSQKPFRDTPRFKFRAVLARTQPVFTRSVEKRGDQSRFKCRKVVHYYAIRSSVPTRQALDICRRKGKG